MDLIDRQALLKQIDIDSDGEPGYYGDTWKFIDTIKNMPNVHDLPKDTDTISRQAAIDAFNTNIDELVVSGKENADAVERYINKVIDAIKQLPPAQPEIVRCKDCKYARLTADGSCKYCDIWFPDEAEYMDGDYYCASAERKSNG